MNEFWKPKRQRKTQRKAVRGLFQAWAEKAAIDQNAWIRQVENAKARGEVCTVDSPISRYHRNMQKHIASWAA